MTDKKFREDLLKLASDNQDHEAAMRVYGQLSRLGLIKPIRFYQNLPVFIVLFTHEYEEDFNVFQTEELAWGSIAELISDSESASEELFRNKERGAEILATLGNNPTIENIQAALEIWNEYYSESIYPISISIYEKEIIK